MLNKQQLSFKDYILSISVGIILLVIALMTLIALLSYSPLDQTWRTSGTGGVKNLLGLAGAWYSDSSLSLFGYASYLLPIGLLTFAAQIIYQKTLNWELLSWRFTMLFIAIPTLSLLLTTYQTNSINSISVTGGGYIGYWIYKGLITSIKPAIIIFAALFTILMALTVIFNLSWLKIIDGLGLLIIKLFTSARKKDNNNSNKKDEIQEKIQQLNDLADKKKTEQLKPGERPVFDEVDEASFDKPLSGRKLTIQRPYSPNYADKSSDNTNHDNAIAKNDNAVDFAETHAINSANADTETATNSTSNPDNSKLNSYKTSVQEFIEKTNKLINTSNNQPSVDNKEEINNNSTDNGTANNAINSTAISTTGSRTTESIFKNMKFQRPNANNATNDNGTVEKNSDSKNLKKEPSFFDSNVVKKENNINDVAAQEIIAQITSMKIETQANSSNVNKVADEKPVENIQYSKPIEKSVLIENNAHPKSMLDTKLDANINSNINSNLATATISAKATETENTIAAEPKHIDFDTDLLNIPTNIKIDPNSAPNTIKFTVEKSSSVDDLFVETKVGTAKSATDLSDLFVNTQVLTADYPSNKRGKVEHIIAVPPIPNVISEIISNPTHALDKNDEPAYEEYFPEEKTAISNYNGTIDKPYNANEARQQNQANIATQKSDEFLLPTIDLLDEPPIQEFSYTEDMLASMANTLEQTLKQFNVNAIVMNVSPGPVITRFELELAPGLQAKKITALSTDLARALAVSSVRVEEIIPGSSYVGLEVPNTKRQIVYFKDIVCSQEFQNSKSPLTLSLGADTSGKPVVADLMKMPHLLVAGTTGSGKSVAINVMLLSMLYKSSPKDLRLILVDPKMLEMSMYEDIPHLLTPVITDMNDAENALTWAVAEMERRYKLMSAMKVRKIDALNHMIDEANANGESVKDPLWEPNEMVGYTKHPDLERLPFIVIVIDELADMMMVVGKQVEQLIARLAQKARAAGIHIILATQRPSVDVLTGLIKANIPTRISFQVSSKIDSRTIIDGMGAEALLGHGDMLYVPPGVSHPKRLHGAFVDDQETDRITTFIRASGEPDYIPTITQKQNPETLGAFGASDATNNKAPEDVDPLYEEAINIVLTTGKASISGIQRQLRIGYNRSARMIEDMQAQGIVSEPINGVRKVLGRR